MSTWRDNPRIRELLETESLKSLFARCFESALSIYEMEEMENDLQRIFLNKYARKGALFKKLIENEDAETEPLMQEFLNLASEVLDEDQDHTPDSMLTLAKLFMKADDFITACEAIWCSALLAVVEFIATNQLRVDAPHRKGKRDVVSLLTVKLTIQFGVFETCHYHSFNHSPQDMDNAYNEAIDFIATLRAYELTDQKRAELEQDDFTCKS